MSMQSYMKLAKELLALINNLEDIYLVDTLTVACFLQATALTLNLHPYFRGPAQTYKIYLHKFLETLFIIQ